MVGNDPFVLNVMLAYSWGYSSPYGRLVGLLGRVGGHSGSIEEMVFG